ncbi:MAG: hypothetical protein ABIJ25_10470 [Pseudomonadota bacterium]
MNIWTGWRRSATAFDPEIPYNDLPPLPPKVDVETKTILKETIAARSALAELKGLGEGLFTNKAHCASQGEQAAVPLYSVCGKSI